MANRPRIQFLFQPARALGSASLAQLACELRAAARRARPDADPPIACEPTALAQRALALARSTEGALVGFASARLLPVPDLGEALHLEGVRTDGPERELLSARLATALVRGYCLRFSFPARLWCVFDSSGPSRLGAAADTDSALGASCAVDEVARRLTRPGGPVPDRWGCWLAGMLTPVATFELAGRVLETGYVRLGAIFARALRVRLARSAWPGAAAPVSRSPA